MRKRRKSDRCKKRTTAGQQTSIPPLLHPHLQRHRQPTLSRSLLGLQTRRVPPLTVNTQTQHTGNGLPCSASSSPLNPPLDFHRAFGVFFTRCQTSLTRAATSRSLRLASPDKVSEIGARVADKSASLWRSIRLPTRTF